MRIPTVIGLGLLYSLSIASAACDTGSFLPSGTYVYEMTSAAGRSVMTSKATSSGNKVTVQSSLDGKAVGSIVWTCSARGMSGSMGNGGRQLSMNTSFLPPASAWKPGYTWTSTSKMDNGTMVMNGTTRSRVVRLEPVSTPAGKFTAYRVESSTSMKMNLPSGVKMPPGMGAIKDTQSTSWYVKGVGMVKNTGQGFSMVLTKYTR